MLNREALKAINKENPTDTESAAILACMLHKTEFLLLFGKDLTIQQQTDDMTLKIMTNILNPKLLPEIQYILKHHNLPAQNNLAVTCLRYIDAVIRLDIVHDFTKLD